MKRWKEEEEEEAIRWGWSEKMSGEGGEWEATKVSVEKGELGSTAEQLGRVEEASEGSEKQQERGCW